VILANSNNDEEREAIYKWLAVTSCVFAICSGFINVYFFVAIRKMQTETLKKQIPVQIPTVVPPQSVIWPNPQVVFIKNLDG